jgi:hypothetical protein
LIALRKIQKSTPKRGERFAKKTSRVDLGEYGFVWVRTPRRVFAEATPVTAARLI